MQIKAVRDYSKVGDALPIPNLVQVQQDAYRRLVQHEKAFDKRDPRLGLEALLKEVFPIVSYDGNMQLEYLYYKLDEPRYTPQECKELRLTYGMPFRIGVRLVRKDVAEISEEEIYLGEIPIMLGGGEFVINGAERVIVNQLHRSPGVDFSIASSESDRPLHSARIIPERGSWIELEVTKKDVLLMRIDQSTKIPATTFLRALDKKFATTETLIRTFHEVATLKVSDLRPEFFAAAAIIDTETGEVLVPAGVAIGDALQSILGIEVAGNAAAGEASEDDISQRLADGYEFVCAALPEDLVEDASEILSGCEEAFGKKLKEKGEDDVKGVLRYVEQFLMVKYAARGKAKPLLAESTSKSSTSAVDKFVKSADGLEYAYVVVEDFSRPDLERLESRLMLDFPDEGKSDKAESHLPRFNRKTTAGLTTSKKDVFLAEWEESASTELKQLYKKCRDAIDGDKSDKTKWRGYFEDPDDPQASVVYFYRAKRTKKVNHGYVGISDRKDGFIGRLKSHRSQKDDSLRDSIAKWLANDKGPKSESDRAGILDAWKNVDIRLRKWVDEPTDPEEWVAATENAWRKEENVPAKPGVYLFRDKSTQKVEDGYVGIGGKRKDGTHLKGRMKSHLAKQRTRKDSELPNDSVRKTIHGILTEERKLASAPRPRRTPGLQTVDVIADITDELIVNTLAEERQHEIESNCSEHEAALLHLYGRLRPGNPPQVEKARQLFAEKFFDSNRYRLGKVGRFRINRKFNLADAVEPDPVPEFIHFLEGTVILAYPDPKGEAYNSSPADIPFFNHDGPTFRAPSGGKKTVTGKDGKIANDPDLAVFEKAKAAFSRAAAVASYAQTIESEVRSGSVKNGWHAPIKCEKVPEKPGIYLFRHEGKIVYVGQVRPRKSGKDLRERLGYHCKGDGDSSFRDHVAKHVGQKNIRGKLLDEYLPGVEFTWYEVGELATEGDGTAQRGGTALSADDFLHVVKYILDLRSNRNKAHIDDIDHLGNRRLRTLDELAVEELRKGFLKLRRTVQERMSVKDPDELAKIADLINSKSISSAIEHFFGRSELSQVVDQYNPLAMLKHERTLSAMGPGGLNRKRAGFEVRDVHISHYGRICPIETPEGTNIGLISTLGIFSKMDQYGFLLTPYRVVKAGKATDEVKYLRADEEMRVTLGSTDAIDPDGRVAKGHVLARIDGDLAQVQGSDIDYIDISPKQIVGVSAALIPFLEHDDANRALMGSNMQRQGVPLVKVEPPCVATGMEKEVPKYSGMVVRARNSGMVTYVDAKSIVIDNADEYALRKFSGLNERTCQNQKPIVQLGHKVTKDQIIADGAATKQGELALGKNVLVAFNTFDGYNFEDAIVMSERLVQNDTFTSIHIEDFDVEIRETKLGREEFTCDIPNVSEKMLDMLDEHGVIQVGAYVRPGDILVGKVSPKSKTEMTPEEKLLHAIFGRAGEDVKNDSLEVPAGTEGIVIGAKRFSRRVHLNDDQRKQLRHEMHTYEAQMDERAAELFRQMIAEINEIVGTPLIDPSTRQKVGASDLTEVVIEQVETFTLTWIKGSKAAREQALQLHQQFWPRIEAVRKEKQRRLSHMKRGDELPSGVLEMVKVYLATKRCLSVGDKMAGRHGNKGVIAKIVPVEDMPFLEDGTPIDVLLNPLGVPSRMNIGQILETHLGWACGVLGFQARTPVFDGATEDEIHAVIEEANQYVKDRFAELEAAKEAPGVDELLTIMPHGGKVQLYDARTGDPFHQRTTVGYMYIMKLHHLVDDKIHARATGPYSLITQQPLGGKARTGGQRFGEMEVWALEGYGAAYVLQELLTVKSDDVEGRTKIYESMVKGTNALEAGMPVAFDVLCNEIRGLGLNITMEKSQLEGTSIL